MLEAITVRIGRWLLAFYFYYYTKLKKKVIDENNIMQGDDYD